MNYKKYIKENAKLKEDSRVLISRKGKVFGIGRVIKRNKNMIYILSSKDFDVAFYELIQECSINKTFPERHNVKEEKYIFQYDLLKNETVVKEAKFEDLEINVLDMKELFKVEANRIVDRLSKNKCETNEDINQLKEDKNILTQLLTEI